MVLIALSSVLIVRLIHGCVMQYRELGRTGLKVSAISLGGAAIGQQYGPVSAAEVGECVHAAIDAGVNLIDTSAYYGKGQSEATLGEVLRGGSTGARSTSRRRGCGRAWKAR